MANISNLDSPIASIRRLIKGYAEFLGSGGLVFYSSPSDYLAITDLYSAIGIRPASKYLDMTKLRSVEMYCESRTELPSPKILFSSMDTTSDDIRFKSILSSQTLKAAEVSFLLTAQADLDDEHRERLVLSAVDTTEEDQKASLRTSRTGKIIRIPLNYYEVLAISTDVECLSGSINNKTEPTRSWSGLKIEEKGVFLREKNKEHDKPTFFGLIMPYAPTTIYSIKNRPINS